VGWNGFTTPFSPPPPPPPSPKQPDSGQGGNLRKKKEKTFSKKQGKTTPFSFFPSPPFSFLYGRWFQSDFCPSGIKILVFPFCQSRQSPFLPFPPFPPPPSPKGRFESGRVAGEWGIDYQGIFFSSGLSPAGFDLFFLFFFFFLSPLGEPILRALDPQKGSSGIPPFSGNPDGPMCGKSFPLFFPLLPPFLAMMGGSWGPRLGEGGEGERRGGGPFHFTPPFRRPFSRFTHFFPPFLPSSFLFRETAGRGEW